MERLAGRVALVSGAAGGIGSAVATRLAEEGARVVGADLRGTPGGVACDVRDRDSCTRAVAAVLDREGRLDVLVNAAGIGASHLIDELPLDEWREIITVNLTGTFLMSQSALAPLRTVRGNIVNVASVAGLRATPYNAAYCASKGGVIMLTRSMAVELAPAGVRVNAVCPGAVDTEFLGRFRLPEGADPALSARATSPTGQRITPEEVAAAVAYLASDEARLVSGTALVIDGAATA